MEFGTILLIVLGGVFYLVIGALFYRLDMELEYLYCPRCGQHMIPIPFENRFLRSLFKINRTCNNLQCRVLKYPSLYLKTLYGFIIPVLIWIPFYIVMVRQELIQEKFMVIISDLITALCMGIALVAMWFFYTHKKKEYKKLNLDVI